MSELSSRREYFPPIGSIVPVGFFLKKILYRIFGISCRKFISPTRIIFIRDIKYLKVHVKISHVMRATLKLNKRGYYMQVIYFLGNGLSFGIYMDFYEAAS